MTTTGLRTRCVFSATLLLGCLASLLGACAESTPLAGICSAPFATCDGACVDVRADRDHCGACGVACATGEECNGGTCDAPVPPDVPVVGGGGGASTGAGGDPGCGVGLVDCGGLCVDTRADPQHCGSCGVACPQGASCEAGGCVCVIAPSEDIGTLVPQRVSGTLVGAADSRSLTCTGAGTPDQGFLFTAPTTGAFLFDTFGSGFDTALSALDPVTCEELACNDDAGGLESQVQLDMIMGTSVLLVVSSPAGGTGDISLNVGRPGPVECSPVALSSALPLSVTGTTVGRGNSAEAVCGFPGDSPDATFTFTAPSDGLYRFDTRGSTLDTILDVRDGATCVGPSLACNDDFVLGVTSDVAVGLTSGQTVLVLVEGYLGSSGPFVLNVGAAPPCTTTDAGSTVPLTLMGTTTGLPDSVGASCATTSGSNVVYLYTAPVDGTYTIDTFGSAFDTVLHVHRAGCYGAEIACDDDAMGAQSEVTVSLAAGEVVAIVVAGYGGASGDFVLNIHN